MAIDLEAATSYVHANARLLDRRRLEHLRGAPARRVLDVLHLYRNDDGGFGHALEPDVRSPTSEPVSLFAALELFTELDALDDPAVADSVRWVASVSEPDGGVPFILPASQPYPHAPWMVPTPGGSHLTFAVPAQYLHAGIGGDPWLDRAFAWAWRRLDGEEPLTGYEVKFALTLLDVWPDAERAVAAIERLRPALRADGSLPVPGGTEDEKVTPLALVPDPAARSRRLFTAEQIEADLDALEKEQQDDGGWTFDWAAWCPGQEVDWRGRLTVDALRTLARHGRLDLG
jgi:hypothetical protein